MKSPKLKPLAQTQGGTLTNYKDPKFYKCMEKSYISGEAQYDNSIENNTTITNIMTYPEVKRTTIEERVTLLNGIPPEEVKSFQSENLV
jgi:hypothetical protein